MDIRTKRILGGVDIARGRGLEVGPLTNPILKKSEANIYYLDHMSTEELKEKYKTEPVDLDKIVEIDYVLHNKSLKEAVKGKKFDYVIASHVIEHIPDMVRWLQGLERILTPQGTVCLIIPDKRYIFDINRRVTLPGEIVGAYLDKLTRFSSAMMYDFASNCVANVPTTEAWATPEKFATARKRWNLKQVYEKCLRNLDPSHYEDCHCYVFTPASFVEILRVLMEYGLLNFKVTHFLETQENDIEFYVNLQRIDPKKVSKRQQLASLPIVTPEPDKIKELEEEVTVLKQELEALQNSVSWRTTRVLRTVRGAQKRPRS